MIKLKDILNEGCGCGCNSCSTSKETKLLNESTRLNLSEGLQYHLDTNTPISNNIYRIYSNQYFNLINEARELHSKGSLQLSEDDAHIVNTDLGRFGVYEGELVPLDAPMLEEESLDETKKKKKKDPPIGKPKRGGSKAYYVYVRDPKTKRVKKVSFGSGGLRAKIRNPKARSAFAKRHRCSEKKDRTKASYWSCNLPRYAPQLGLGAKINTFW